MSFDARSLREALCYDPDTGVFTRRTAAGRLRVGDLAGCVEGEYLIIGVGRQHYKAHHLAWLYMTGEWPAYIDHIDGNSLNNRFANLRLSTHSENMRNQVSPRKDNTSGFRGVCRSRNGKWQANITVSGKQRHLGIFSTPEEASDAYWAAKAALHGVDTYRVRLEREGHDVCRGTHSLEATAQAV